MEQISQKSIIGGINAIEYKNKLIIQILKINLTKKYRSYIDDYYISRINSLLDIDDFFNKYHISYSKVKYKEFLYLLDKKEHLIKFYSGSKSRSIFFNYRKIYTKLPIFPRYSLINEDCGKIMSRHVSAKHEFLGRNLKIQIFKKRQNMKNELNYLEISEKNENDITLSLSEDSNEYDIEYYKRVMNDEINSEYSFSRKKHKIKKHNGSIDSIKSLISKIPEYEDTNTKYKRIQQMFNDANKEENTKILKHFRILSTSKNTNIFCDFQRYLGTKKTYSNDKIILTKLNVKCESEEKKIDKTDKCINENKLNEFDVQLPNIVTNRNKKLKIFLDTNNFEKAIDKKFFKVKKFYRSFNKNNLNLFNNYKDGCKNKCTNLKKTIHKSIYKNSKENKIYKEIDYLVNIVSNKIKDMKDISNYNKKCSYNRINCLTSRNKINLKKKLPEKKESIEEYFSRKNLNLNEGNYRKKVEDKFDIIKFLTDKTQANDRNGGNKKKKKYYMSIDFRKINNLNLYKY